MLMNVRTTTKATLPTSRPPATVARWAVLLVSVGVVLSGCASGKCFVRFQRVAANGQVTSDECLVDTCPKGAAFDSGKNVCACQPPTVTLQGACVSLADANAHCGATYTYANGGCVAKTCPPGQVLNASTGACDNKAATDQAVAANAGVSITPGHEIGCPPNYTYMITGAEGACIPNELTCGPGTRYAGGQCVTTACPAGSVFDVATSQCATLKTGGDDKIFSVQTKLNSMVGPELCAPHAKNPAAWHVAPGGTLTVKIAVTVTIPNNDIEQTQAGAVRVTNVGGADLTPAMFPGVANVSKQVNEQIVPNVRALGGKSAEPQATATVTCVIRRAPIQIVETHGGGL